MNLLCMSMNISQMSIMGMAINIDDQFSKNVAVSMLGEIRTTQQRCNDV